MGSWFGLIGLEKVFWKFWVLNLVLKIIKEYVYVCISILSKDNILVRRENNGMEKRICIINTS